MSKLVPMVYEDYARMIKYFNFPITWSIEYAHFAFNEVRDGTHDTPTYFSEGIPLITSKNLKDKGIDFSSVSYISNEDYLEISKRSGVAVGDILFSMIGTIGNISLVGETQAFAIKNVGLFRKNIQLLIPKFSYYWLKSQSYREWLKSHEKGGTQKFVSLGVLRESPVPVPPLAEQKVIADKLDSLLAQVDNIKTRLDALPTIIKRFKQSVLSAAVSGKLTEEWRGKIRLVQWENKIIGDLIKEGPQNGIYKPSSFYGEGTKIVRIDGFYEGKMCDWETIKRVQLDEAELAKWQLKPLDILINRVNSIEYLGKCCLVRSLPEPAVFESNIMRVTLNADMANPEFVIIYFTSILGIERLRSNAKLAVNQASINQTDVKVCKIELPPLEEQTEIVRRVEQLFAYADQIEQQVKNAQSRVNNLTQSILAKAFRGELTADWRAANPHLISGENSAQALLAKIKAERDKPKKTSKQQAMFNE